MNLDPQDRKNWQGFLDLLEPPVGYRLAAAVGTTFGLSIDALTAALLAMSDADGEALAAEPLAALMAITRLSRKVRVLVHPGTVSGSSHPDSNRFVALLDRVVAEVQPSKGLFHPKVWALRFERTGAGGRNTPNEIGRLVVGSRNLNTSTSFELGAVFEGTIDDEPSPFSADVAEALRSWLGAVTTPIPDAVTRLPQFVRRLALDIPQEAEDLLRLRWQGLGREPLVAGLPDRMNRAVVVSPFVQPDFVVELLSRSRTLKLVSIPESLDRLPDETIAAAEERRQAQGFPVLYHVTEHGDPDDAYIDGIHAKLLLVEDAKGRPTAWVGSANATGPGWGSSGAANVEAMVEMRPGIGIDRFVSGFIRENKTKVHPWITEYDRSAQPVRDPAEEAERQMLTALREVAKIQLVLRYDAAAERLTLARSSKKVAAWALETDGVALEFHVAPLLLADRRDGWRPLADLDSGVCEFGDVKVTQLTTFVAVRARSRKPRLEETRFVLARLAVSDSVMERRDEAVRAEILATADPAVVLNALIRGLAHIHATDGRTNGNGGHGPSLPYLLGATTLEGLLQAVATDPGLVGEMRLLLGPLGGPAFLTLCDDLDAVVQRLAADGEA